MGQWLDYLLDTAHDMGAHVTWGNHGDKEWVAVHSLPGSRTSEFTARSRDEAAFALCHRESFVAEDTA